MIIVQAIGGLGNQLFQYAAGRSLAQALKMPLKLDIVSFKNYGLHQGFELNKVFGSHIEIASKADLHQVLGWRALEPVRRILVHPRAANARSLPFISEPHLSYWEKFSDIEQSAYLIGYWQSEKYFDSIAKLLREDLQFKAPLSIANKNTLANIQQTTAISVHIRRGDYISPENLALHGICSNDYYRQAIERMAQEVSNPKFFIFSDDMAWVKSHFPIHYPHEFIDQNHGGDSFNDMRLMSSCQHHIIANSSFSWWGAWLNPNPEKVVIAPKNWFASLSRVNHDIYPAGWLLL